MRFTQVFTVDLQLTAPILINIAKFQSLYNVISWREEAVVLYPLFPLHQTSVRDEVEYPQYFEENIDFTIGTTNAEELADKRTEEKDR